MSAGSVGRLAFVAALGYLVLLCLIEFATMLLPGPWQRTYVTAGDFSQQFYAFQTYAAQRLAHGQLPLWDPYIFGGQAHLADPQTALFYPVGLLINLAAGHGGLAYGALEWRGAIDVMLGATFTDLFVGHVARSRVAGVVGAVAFCFGGYLTSYPLAQLPVLEASIWLPLILYCLERGLATPGESQGLDRVARVATIPNAEFLVADTSAAVVGPRPALLGSDKSAASAPRGGAKGSVWFGYAGLAGAVLLLAGHGQTALLAASTVTGYSLLRWLMLRRSPLLTSAQLLLAAAIAAGISAPQWLPTLLYLPVTNRVALSYAAASGGFQWPELRQILLPGGYFLRSCYVGLLPLILALLALRRRAAWAWLALAVMASLLALGRYGPLFPLLYGRLPGFASFEDQERAAYLVTFALAVLAGLGAAEVMSWTRKGRGKIASLVISVPAFAFTVAGGALLRQYAPPADNPALIAPLAANVGAAALLAGGAMLMLVGIWRGWVPKLSAAALLCLLPAINLLAADSDLGRTTVNPLPALPVQAAAYLHRQQDLWRVDTLRDGELPRNVGAELALSFPRGNDPLVIVRSAALAGQADRYKVWQLFNVQYLLSHQNPGSGFQKVAQLDGFNVFHMLYPLPRAWAVRDVVTVASPAQALSATMALAQPGARAVLEAAPDSTVVGSSPLRDQREEWLQAEPEYLHLRVTLSDGALLVLSQPYAPGWSATIDGRAANLLRADYAFDALAVPAGTHDVVLRYVPAGLFTGLIGAAAALLLFAGSLVFSWRLALRGDRTR